MLGIVWCTNRIEEFVRNELVIDEPEYADELAATLERRIEGEVTI